MVYTNGMKDYVVNATTLKTNCLALLDEIDEHGGTITITKRGRPVATLGPAPKKGWKSCKGILAGKTKFARDIATMNTADQWDVVRNPAGLGISKAPSAKRQK